LGFTSQKREATQRALPSVHRGSLTFDLIRKNSLKIGLWFATRGTALKNVL